MEEITKHPVNPNAMELSKKRFSMLQMEKESLAQKINFSLPYEDNEELVSAYVEIIRMMDEVLLIEARYLVALEQWALKHV